ncbi:hypothetical protein ACQEVZ_27690 [Dactylosporangium sp. CA-152071]|uniref:hypothetical protein n=1 Tax=Dactylosporangium sp. CA-152071 TaxID=3239933 RepID=UPI003D941E00
MTISGAKTTGSPAATAFFIFAAFWVLAAILVGVGLWQEPPSTPYGDEPDVFAENAGAVTAIAVCAVGASVFLIGGFSPICWRSD